MNKLKIVILGLLFFPIILIASPLNTPQDYLKAMVNTHQNGDFELIYFLKQGENIESARYRHATQNNEKFAQLLRLDNTREEIILRNDTVSYFGYNFQPFSLHSSAILDSLPSAFYSHFNGLDDYYHFVDGGRARIADRIAHIIRITPKDEFRYQYQLWIDEDSHLLLKSELQDRDNNVLEEFHVLQATSNADFTFIIKPIRSLSLPAVVPNELKQSDLNWQATWLPDGFKQITSEKLTLSALMREEPIESQFYSDGLFSFSIYLVENKGVWINDQFWQDEKLSIYSQTINNRDVVIIGEIPLSTAKYIVQHIRFNENVSAPKVAEQTIK